MKFKVLLNTFTPDSEHQFMTDNSAKFYDRFTSLYPFVELFLKPQKNKFFNEVNRCSPGRLLEIGIGNGSNLTYYNHHQVVGIDTSRSMLEQASSLRMKNVQLFQMNGENLEFPNESFDYVVLSHVIAVVENPKKVLDEVYRVLKPNGKIFILNHFTPDNALKYLDSLFAKVSALLHFRSEFPISGLVSQEKLRLLNEHDVGFFSYFKILIYEKIL